MCTQLSTIKLIIAPPIPPKNLLQQQKHHPQTNPNKKNTESPFDFWTWGEVKGREMSCWRVGLVTAARAPYCLSSDTPAVHGTQAEEGDRSQICNQKAEEKHFKHTFCSWLLWNTSKGNCIAGCKKKKNHWKHGQTQQHHKVPQATQPATESILITRNIRCYFTIKLVFFLSCFFYSILFCLPKNIF